MCAVSDTDKPSIAAFQMGSTQLFSKSTTNVPIHCSGIAPSDASPQLLITSNDPSVSRHLYIDGLVTRGSNGSVNISASVSADRFSPVENVTFLVTCTLQGPFACTGNPNVKAACVHSHSISRTLPVTFVGT